MTRQQAYWMTGAWTACMLIGTQIIACTPVKISPVSSNCLPIVTYSPEFQNSFASELTEIHASNHYPHVEQFIVDAEQTRDGLRACR